MKRLSLRSIAASRSMSRAPCTCDLKPSEAYSSLATIPERPTRRASSTSCLLLPMLETMPSPVTTTRLTWSTLEGVFTLEQTDAHVLAGVDQAIVHLDLPVGDTHVQPAHDDPLERHPVAHHRAIRRHLAGEAHLAGAQRPAVTGAALPAEEESDQLPQRVDPEAARHDRVAHEVALEEPQVRIDVQLRHHLALAVLAAVAGDVRDAVKHQHRRQRQLGIARAEQLAAAAGEDLLAGVMTLGLEHGVRGSPLKGGDFTFFAADSKKGAAGMPRRRSGQAAAIGTPGRTDARRNPRHRLGAFGNILENTTVSRPSEARRGSKAP